MDNKKNQYFLELFGLLSFFSLALFLYISQSLSALHHIFLVLALFFYFSKKRPLVKLTPSQWCLLGLVAWGGITILANIKNMDSPLRNFTKLKYYLFGVLAFYPLREVIAKTKNSQKRNLIHCFLIFSSVASIVGIIALFSGFNILKFKEACHESRACGVYGMAITYGYGIGLFSVLQISLLAFYKKLNLSNLINYKLLLFSSFINLLGLYFSYTRGALIALFISLPFLAIGFKQTRYLLVAFLLSGFIFGSLFFVPKIKDTFTNKYRVESSLRRISNLKSSFYAFNENKVFGLGFKNFEPNNKLIKKRYGMERTYFGGHAHNNIMEHLASMGLIGGMLTLFFHLFWFVEMLKVREGIGAIGIPFNVAVFIGGLFQYTLGDGENLFLIMPFYALTQVLYKRNTNRFKTAPPAVDEIELKKKRNSF